MNRWCRAGGVGHPHPGPSRPVSQRIGDGGGAGIGVGVRGAHRHHQHPGIAAGAVDAQLAQPVCEHPHQARVLAEGFGLQYVDPGIGDDCWDVDAGVVGAGQQQRSHDCRSVESGEHIAQVGCALLAESHPNVQT